MASNADSHNSSSTSFITHLVDSSHLKTVPSKFKFINDPSGLTLDSLPVVDFSALTGGDPDRRSKAIHDLAKACEEWGFFIVVNHGIPEALMNATFAAVLPKNTNESRIKEKSDIFSWSILDDLFAKFSEIEQTSPYISIELLSTTFPMISTSVYFVYVPWFPWILHVHQPNSCFPWFPLRPTFRGTFAVHEILSSTKQLKNCGTERSEFAW